MASKILNLFISVIGTIVIGVAQAQVQSQPPSEPSVFSHSGQIDQLLLDNTVEVVSRPDAPGRFYANMKGVFDRKDWTLLANQNSTVVVKDGKFSVLLLLNEHSGRLDLLAIGPLGEMEEQSFVITATNLSANGQAQVESRRPGSVELGAGFLVVPRFRYVTPKLDFFGIKPLSPKSHYQTWGSFNIIKHEASEGGYRLQAPNYFFNDHAYRYYWGSRIKVGAGMLFRFDRIEATSTIDVQPHIDLGVRVWN